MYNNDTQDKVYVTVLVNKKFYPEKEDKSNEKETQKDNLSKEFSVSTSIKNKS